MDGTKFSLPRAFSWTLHFPRGRFVRLPMCVEEKIPFTMTGIGGHPQVGAVGGQGWKAAVCMDVEREDNGVIVVTAPDKPGKGSVLVVVTDSCDFG